MPHAIFNVEANGNDVGKQYAIDISDGKDFDEAKEDAENELKKSYPDSWQRYELKFNGIRKYEERGELAEMETLSEEEKDREHESGENIMVYGYQTENFENAPKLCHTIRYMMDNFLVTESRKDDFRKCVENIDDILGIEKRVTDIGESSNLDVIDVIELSMEAQVWLALSNNFTLLSDLYPHINNIVRLNKGKEMLIEDHSDEEEEDEKINTEKKEIDSDKPDENEEEPISVDQSLSDKENENTEMVEEIELKPDEDEFMEATID